MHQQTYWQGASCGQDAEPGGLGGHSRATRLLSLPAASALGMLSCCQSAKPGRRGSAHKLLHPLVHCHLTLGRLNQPQEQVLHWQQHPAYLSAEPKAELCPASSLCLIVPAARPHAAATPASPACRVTAVRPLREAAGAPGASVQMDPQDTELAVQELTQHHKLTE